MSRKLAHRKERKILPFRIKRGTRPSLLSQRLLGLLLGTGKEIDQ